MGQEYDETAPFQFFCDFGDPALQRAVSEGRRNEFKDFNWTEVPDPQDSKTFERSRLHWDEVTDNNPTLRWYRALIALRRTIVMSGERTCEAELRDGSLVMRVPAMKPKLVVIADFPNSLHTQRPEQGWTLMLESDADKYALRVYHVVEADRREPTLVPKA